MAVKEFELAAGGRTVRWRFKGQQIDKTYEGPIEATVLSDASGVLIVEPGMNRPDNALIFNGDGSPRLRISNPFTYSGAVCFSDVGYEGGELTLISQIKARQMACVISEDGHHVRQYEIR